MTSFYANEVWVIFSEAFIMALLLIQTPFPILTKISLISFKTKFLSIVYHRSGSGVSRGAVWKARKRPKLSICVTTLFTR